MHGDIKDDTVFAYLAAEEALGLYRDLAPSADEIRRALAEAAYRLSDELEPDERAELLSSIEVTVDGEATRQERLEAALVLANDAAAGLDRLLCTPETTIQLDLAHAALIRAVRALAPQIGWVRAAELLVEPTPA